MKTRLLRFIATVVVALPLASGQAADDFPHAELANTRVAMRFALPDAERGFYRGTRFDWSGIVTRATCDGVVFFEPWRTPHDPHFHDAVSGPAEEFGQDAPLGYDEAKPGETFIKIGVGHLEKTADEAYGFFRRYRVVTPGAWTIERAADAIVFRQELRDPRGWGYRYEKKIALREAGFVIARTLENIGTRAIATEHYGHNFIRIGGHAIGPDYRLRFPFAVSQTVAKPAPGAIAGETLTPPLEKSFYAELAGFHGAGDHAVTVEHAPSGVAISLRGDRAPVKWRVYAEPTALCPEPFVSLDLAPGTRASWQTEYRFHTGGQAAGAIHRLPAEQKFRKFDLNGDGKVTIEEHRANSSAKDLQTGAKDPAKADRIFRRKDKNGDDALVLEEFRLVVSQE